MIPRKVKLQGFLCYQDTQEIDFQGAPLWMLAGLNGSGKSTVFDAVTYALFGHHRAGTRDAQELINKEADGFTVEFDFTLDGQEYRIRRTIKRVARGSPKATRQVLRRRAGDAGDDGWTPIEGTSQDAGFKEWVREQIGLTYDTFTSSVLLLQGKAEKLLDSTAKGRFEVLASIVDLERYEKLHRRSDDHRRKLGQEVETFQGRIHALPEVTPLEVAIADGRIETAREVRGTAEAEVERLRELHHRAEQWLGLQRKLGEAVHRWEQAQRLFGDAEAIERDHAEWTDLREVLPRLEAIGKHQRDAANAETRGRDLAAQLQKLDTQLGEREHALEQVRLKRSRLQSRVTEDEAKHRELSAKLPTVVRQLEQLKEYENLERKLAQLQEELRQLLADPEVEVGRLREGYEEVSALQRALPSLVRLRRAREELRGAGKREVEARQGLAAIEARGRQLAQELEKLKPAAEKAEGARRHADEQAAETRTLLQRAKAHLDEVTQLHGSKVCRHCGQELTPAHLTEERRRRSTAATEAERRYQEASRTQAAAREQEQQVGTRCKEVEAARQEAREEFRDEKRHLEAAQQDRDRLLTECGQSYADLPEAFRQRVSPTPPTDWTATAYPAEEEVTAARSRAAAAEALRKQLRQAEESWQQWKVKKEQESAGRQELARRQAELPADRSRLRMAFQGLEAEVASIGKSVEAGRREEREAEQQMERLRQEREATQKERGRLEGDMKREEAVREACAREIGRARKELPPDWQGRGERVGMAELNTWKTRLNQLLVAQAEERYDQLRQARASVEELRRTREERERELATFPPEACQDPGRIQHQLVGAREELKRRDEELFQASKERDRLEEIRRERARLEQELLDVAREHKYYKLLSELLDREHLQLHLVRTAERQVIEHANVVLDRLSDGQLHLQLRGVAGGEGEAAAAMELEVYNRVTGDKPINVGFLSGSQKFRVAVALALGIGRYASRQHRPIEAVIIDEGFGCLDRQGRLGMIQEMQKLRGEMRCILLVSHQEDFADAFADGYHFELKDGKTQVSRFQR